MARFILSPAFLQAARCESPFFTRSRDLPLPLLISFLLNGVRGAVQSELDAFFALLRGRTRLCRVVSAAAFAKPRSHLLGTVFDRLNAELLRLSEVFVGLPHWQDCGYWPATARSCA